MQKSEGTENRLEKQFGFLRELDQEKQIIRQTYLADGSRFENDAEHAWHMAVMALFLSEYSNEKIDLLKTISMILLHDVVEIDAGDTYAYDEEAKKTQKERELRAAERIFGLLPEDQEKRFRALWDEFEAWETPEAKFAHAMDNVQPLMLNAASDGKTWEEHQIGLDRVLERNGRSKEGSQELWAYAYENFILPSVKNGKLRTE